MTKKEASIEYRKVLKSRILDTALDMFRQNGLKAVKMDDISHALGISKRTLYEIYPNKEDLIIEALKMGFSKSRENLRHRISNSSDTMDILIEFFRLRLEESLKISSTLLDDIQQYPKIKEYFECGKDEHADRVLSFLKKGQDEGYFLKDININLVHEINNTFSDHFINSRLYQRYDVKELHRNLLVLFVRSLCTTRGIERIDQLLCTL